MLPTQQPPEALKIEFLRAIHAGDGLPAFDLEVCFKDADGVLNHLALALQITGQADAPGIVQNPRLFIGAHAGVRDERQPIQGIVFDLHKPASLAKCLADLAGELSALSTHTILTAGVSLAAPSIAITPASQVGLIGETP